MKIKVCGMRDGENIRRVSELGVDYIGMIFWPKSPRNVTMIPTHAGIIPDRASDLSTLSPLQSPQKVGVFVDEMAQNIITRVVNYQLDVVQLHGKEQPTLIRNLRATLSTDIRPGLLFWKAISIGTAADLQQCQVYEDCVDAFVFDTRCASVGGSGRHFDWSLLDAYHGSKPFMLSGGIGPDDAIRVKAFSHPSCMGVDLNSRFETAPAVKDVEALQRFIAELRQ